MWQWRVLHVAYGVILVEQLQKKDRMKWARKSHWELVVVWEQARWELQSDLYDRHHTDEKRIIRRYLGMIAKKDQNSTVDPPAEIYL